MKYLIGFTETNWYTVEVEADSEKEAERIAEDELVIGMTEHWSGGEVICDGVVGP